MSAKPPMAAVVEEGKDVGLARLAHSGSLLERTAHGALWVIGWRLATRLLGMIDTLVLVRLLLPADFGLVALGYSFVTSLDTLLTFGVGAAIIRDDHPDRDLYDTGFTINLIRAAAMGIVLAAFATTIARVLANPRLVDIVLAFAAVTAITGVTNIGVVDFNRYIAFDKEFVYKLVPRVLSITVAITIAIVWRSYWALVGGIVTGSVATAAFSYVVHPFRPRLTLRAWRRLLGYSSWMWVLGLIGTLRGQAPILILGRLMGASAVGILSVSTDVASMPTTELVAPLSRACFPAFAAARQEGDEPAGAFLRLLGAMALLTLPAGFGISLVAFPVVKLAFGAVWLTAVPLVQVLGVAGVFTLFGMISGSLFGAHAWLREAAMADATTTAVCVVLLGLLVPRYGALGAAIAIAAADGFNQMIYLAVTLRRLGLRLSELVARVWRSTLATAVMTVVLTGAGLGWSRPTALSQTSLILQLVSTVLLGAIIYFAALLAAWLVAGRPSGAETDLWELAKRLFSRVVIRQTRA